MPSTGHGPLSSDRAGRGRRAAGRRRRPHTPLVAAVGQNWNEVLSTAAVILAGVFVVVAFGFVVSRAMRTENTAATLPTPPGPALGNVTLPSASQDLIPLGSATPSPSPTRPTPASPSPSPSSPTPSRSPSADPGAIRIARGSVPTTVDLSEEGARDWVHWGAEGTFSLERDKKGEFAILEGAPTAPRFRHALSPQLFAWTGGDPVEQTDGTTTGIRTCGKNNGFTLSAPAGTRSRVLKLYVGVLAAKGRLEAKLSTGTATATAELQQRDGVFRTAVLTVTYRAPKDGDLKLRWITAESFDKDCGGVALQAASLR